MYNLSQTLKSLLQKAKLSESELGRQTGIPQQVINRILLGKNLNPKITTLTSLATYFSLSISQLLGEDTIPEREINPHLGWRSIPFLEWNTIGQRPIDVLVAESKKTVMTDIYPTGVTFATKMMDDSMEPKFSDKTLLIFNRQDSIKDKGFALIYSPSDKLLLRQIFTKKGGNYQKSLNPTSKNYKLSPLEANTIYLGLLIQSRTDHVL